MSYLKFPQVPTEYDSLANLTNRITTRKQDTWRYDYDILSQDTSQRTENEETTRQIRMLNQRLREIEGSMGMIQMMPTFKELKDHPELRHAYDAWVGARKAGDPAIMLEWANRYVTVRKLLGLDQ